MTNNDEMALNEEWRDDFEKIFPIPAGMERHPPRKDGGMAGYINKTCLAGLAFGYINYWEGYRAARESLLAERDADKKRIEMLEKYVNDRDAQNQDLLLNIGSLQQRIAELEDLATDYGMKFQRAQDDLKHMALMHRGEVLKEKRLPEPYAYLRENDGQIQISIGSERPSDRSGGYATPWFAIYTAAGINLEVGE